MGLDKFDGVFDTSKAKTALAPLAKLFNKEVFVNIVVTAAKLFAEAVYDVLNPDEAAEASEKKQ